MLDRPARWALADGSVRGCDICRHEHACIRCPVLQINPKMVARLNELEKDLLLRRQRAEAESWLGEIDGIDQTLVFLRSKRDEVLRSTSRPPSTWAFRNYAVRSDLVRPAQPGDHQAAGQQPEPLSATAILSFQDAVEHFLLIAADHLRVNLPSSMQFLQYWERLKPALPDGQDLPSKQALDRVNKIRVALKHYGTIPSTQAILQAKADVTTFFTDATKLIFSVDFTSLDMIDLVARQQTIDFLRYSETCMEKGDLHQALAGLSIAFTELIDHYTGARQTGHYRRPFRFGGRLDNYTDQQFRIVRDRTGQAARLSDLLKFVGDISRQVADLTKSTRSMQRAMQMTALGVDYRRYAQFAMVVPEIRRTFGGTQFAVPGFVSLTDVDGHAIPHFAPLGRHVIPHPGDREIRHGDGGRKDLRSVRGGRQLFGQQLHAETSV
ncbi:hypothetical protein AB6O49_34815 [Streptomyces sp. SBR177]